MTHTDRCLPSGIHDYLHPSSRITILVLGALRNRRRRHLEGIQGLYASRGFLENRSPKRPPLVDARLRSLGNEHKKRTGLESTLR